MKLVMWFTLLCSITMSQTTPTSNMEIQIEDSLNVLKNVMNEEEKIREFFYEHMVGQRNEVYLEADSTRNYCGQPSNCAELMYTGVSKSGVYNIYPKPWINKPKVMKVFCDMETDGGGWTVFQKRTEVPDRQINFTKTWTAYADGFGNLNEEFWLGNNNLHVLTIQDNMVLRIDLEDFEGNRRYASYNVIEVGNESDLYKLKISDYRGNAGDSLGDGNGQSFVTYDHDNEKNCAQTYKGGWWYRACHLANLNGKYLAGKHESFADGIEWKTWLGYNYSLKRTEMKVRPKSFGCS